MYGERYAAHDQMLLGLDLHVVRLQKRSFVKHFEIPGCKSLFAYRRVSCI